jgi:hypothetical protein
VRILDFGIARMLGIASNTAVMIGTPGYMAPEQITGEPVDHRSDLFSIGVVFYELLAYAEPFPGDTLPMITHRIVHEEPTPLEQLAPDLSPDIIAIVRQAMRKRSAERFKDAETLRIAIARVRRQYESDDDWNRPTMPVGFDTTPLSGGNRGTGSSRRRSNDAVGIAQMTPPPDPRRTDREALARRRTAQVEAALTQARALFGQRKLDEALDACQQALTLDETHTGALELEEEIQTALRIQEGLEIAADDSVDSALTAAAEPSSYRPGLAASRLLESQMVTRAHEQAFVVTGLPPASSERPSDRDRSSIGCRSGCSANTTSSGSRGRRSRTSRVRANEMGGCGHRSRCRCRGCRVHAHRRYSGDRNGSHRRGALGEHHRDSERGRRLAAATVTAVHAGVTGTARRHVSDLARRSAAAVEEGNGHASRERRSDERGTGHALPIADRRGVL